jgi:hypothetical protein
VRALRLATRVVIIGFSMPRTDMHFKYLLAAGLKENISLRKIVVIDPALSGENASKFKRRIGGTLNRTARVEFVAGTLEGALVRTASETLRKLGRAATLWDPRRPI